MEKNKLTDDGLLELAREERRHAYAPYSNTTVGAALLCESGRVYLGSNIENAAYSPSVCAERVAIFKAISAGERIFCAIAVSGGKAESKARDEFFPCGVCRQVMAEFCGGDFRIILDSDGGAKSLSLAQLLPYQFGKEKL